MSDINYKTELSSVPTMALPSYSARLRRNKIILLALLVLLLLGVGLAFARYYLDRELPLPTVEAVEKGKVVPPSFLFAITGEAKSPLYKPLGIAIHANGDIYVGSLIKNKNEGRVDVFGKNGRYKFSFNKIGSGGTLKAPLYLAINGDGDVHVTDKNLHAIYVFKETGQFIKKFIPNNDPKFTIVPVAVAFDKQDNFYVTDVYKEHRVLVFKPDGHLKLQFGGTVAITDKGQAPGKFYFPNGIFVDKDNNIFVADSNNRRVQVFNQLGKYSYTIETGGLPRGIAVDGQDRFYVVDALGHDVSVYKKTTREGQPLTIFGEQGISYGQFLYPNSLVLDNKGHRILVTDRENNRVQVWAWPSVVAAVSIPAKKAIPLFLILLALLPPLIAMLMRRRRYFASADFINKVIIGGNIPYLESAARRLYVHPQVYESLKSRFDPDSSFVELMRPLKIDEVVVASMQNNYGFNEEIASLFASADRGWVKPRFLTEENLGHTAAAKLNYESMDYDLFLEFYVS